MTQKRKTNIIRNYVAPFLAMAGMGIGGGLIVGHMKDISKPITFNLPNGNQVLADGNSYTVTNSAGKAIKHFNSVGIGLDYTDPTGAEYRITEKGYCTKDASGDYVNFVPFTEDSTIYWVKKEFEDIKGEEDSERAKRKNLEGKF